MIVLLPGCFVFCPKMIVWLYAWLEIEAQSQISSHKTFYVKKFFGAATIRDRFGVVVVLYFRSHTYNYEVSVHRALISPKIETQIIILERREYYSAVTTSWVGPGISHILFKIVSCLMFSLANIFNLMKSNEALSSIFL